MCENQFSDLLSLFAKKNKKQSVDVCGNNKEKKLQIVEMKCIYTCFLNIWNTLLDLKAALSETLSENNSFVRGYTDTVHQNPPRVRAMYLLLPPTDPALLTLSIMQ